MPDLDIIKSTRAYENWLREQLRGQIVEKDLEEKHEKMDADAFQFLRATFWRWAETVDEFCPGLDEVPQVLAVGDIHLENYGVWRDADGRLVWGVNDFDESAVMPYVLDLVRLATSALLARGAKWTTSDTVCAAVTKGYAAGLRAPRPFVLDYDHPGLRRRFAVTEEARAAFWRKIEKQRAKAERKRPSVPAAYADALCRAMPERVPSTEFWPRSAGTGSLGRPRWVAFAEWRGGPILREAKALVPSGWTRTHAPGDGEIRAGEIATGRYRAPDPWYSAQHRMAVRRLSPNSRKLTVAGEPRQLLTRKMLAAMGYDLASIHLATKGSESRVPEDFAARRGKWLPASVAAAVAFVEAEQAEWEGRSRRTPRKAARGKSHQKT